MAARTDNMSAAGSDNRGERLRRGMTVIVTVLGLAAGVVACGSASDPEPGTPESNGPTAPGATTTPGAGAELAVAEVRPDVGYYGACGNEVLTLPDVTYYPMHLEDWEPLDQDAYRALLQPSPTAALGGGGILAALPMVVPPGPGDDTGTLTIFTDGIAVFVSDNGDETWLTHEVREYNWDC